MKRITARNPKMTATLALLLGASYLLPAQNSLTSDQRKQRGQITSRQQLELPAGGTLRLPNAVGNLTVEGWDQPTVEITVIKSTVGEYVPSEQGQAARELDPVLVAPRREGKDLVVVTTMPKTRWFQSNHSIVEYRIKVPRETSLVIDEKHGQVYVDGVTGDIQAISKQGGITLHLPEDGQYSIDAQSKLGSVVSDFPGSTRRKHWVGHTFVQNAQAARKLHLREGLGDILILKAHTPHE